jgi:hypothetical protein
VLFLEFVNGLLGRLPVAVPGAPGKIFLWDNLKSHFNGRVTQTIYAAGHSIIARPPYQPRDGPIDYIFNYLDSSGMPPEKNIPNQGIARSSLAYIRDHSRNIQGENHKHIHSLWILKRLSFR